MTPLRRRMLEDMQLRGLAPTTQRSYLHYVAEFARYYNSSPQKLDLEAIRQYEIHLLNERKMSPQAVWKNPGIEPRIFPCSAWECGRNQAGAGGRGGTFSASPWASAQSCPRDSGT